MKGSLRTKIITWSFVPTAIILVVVALVSLYTYQQVTEDLVIERDRDLTRLAASLLASELAAYTDPLSPQSLAVYDGLIVFDEDGAVLAAEPEQYARWQPSWLEDVYQDRAFSSAEPAFSDVVVDKLQGEKLIIVVMPNTGPDGVFVGGIAGLFRLDAATDSALYLGIEKIRRRESTCVYLVDGNGRVIYHSTASYIGEDLTGQEVVGMALNDLSGAYRTHGLAGREIVASFAAVPGTPWSLVVEESWAALTASSRRYGQLLLILLVVGVAVPALIVAVGVRRITQPIADLIRAAQELASGHFGRRISASTGGELEELAEQFNLMAAQLQESYGQLERKVADRTRELATLNAIAADVSRSLELGEILNSALDRVVTTMDMGTGQAFRLEEESQILVLMAHRGLSQELVCATSQVPLAGSVAGQAALEGQPVVREVGAHPKGEWGDVPERDGTQLVISIPLMSQERMLGAINLSSRVLRDVGPEELSLLAAIGHQIGVAVENARLYEQAQELAVVQERSRLARDLHDSVTQALYGATLYAEAAARQLASGDVQLATRHLREIRDTAQESLREMRLLIFELRPPILRREGLAAALQARLDAVEGRVGLETSLEVTGDGQLPPAVEEGLYRIAQEALNNALKHAQAHTVTVRLQRNGQAFSLEITDDGVGFDPLAVQDQSGFGLRGMEERAARLGGTLGIQSSSGKGTTIKVKVEVYS